MSIQAVLRENYGEFFTRNGVLNGIPVTDRTPADKGDVYWRFTGDTDWQFLGSATVGNSVNAPLDLQGRQIELAVRSQTEGGQFDVIDLNQAPRTTFSVGGVALISNATFSSGAGHLTLVNNGGVGDIKIMRRVGTDDFAEIDSVSSGTATYDDTSLVINGDYDYQLAQDGQEGFSNIKTITATGLGSTAGSPPDTLAGVHDGIDTVGLSWSNHGATADNVIERKLGSDPFAIIAFVSSGTTTYDDTIIPDEHSRVYYFRVSNGSVVGTSNVLPVYVAAAV